MNPYVTISFCFPPACQPNVNRRRELYRREIKRNPHTQRRRSLYSFILTLKNKIKIWLNKRLSSRIRSCCCCRGQLMRGRQRTIKRTVRPNKKAANVKGAELGDRHIKDLPSDCGNKDRCLRWGRRSIPAGRQR